MKDTANRQEADFSFDKVSNLFVEAHSCTPPSQLHGLLCGQLSAGLRPSQQNWLATAADQMSAAREPDASIRGQLLDFHDAVLGDLFSEDFTFALLLPDMDESVELRTEALGQWCAGFLSGYGMAGTSQSTLSEEAAGVLQDLAQIALVQIEDLEASEESEKDFFEVCEYVRMATLMLFGEHQESRPEPQQVNDKKAVH